MPAEEFFNLRRTKVAVFETNYLRWRPQILDYLKKVRVGGDDREAITLGVLPDQLVSCRLLQTDVEYVGGFRK